MFDESLSRPCLLDLPLVWCLIFLKRQRDDVWYFSVHLYLILASCENFCYLIALYFDIHRNCAEHCKLLVLVIISWKFSPISKNVSPKLFLRMYNESPASPEAIDAVAMLRMLVWEAAGDNLTSNPGVRDDDGEVKSCRLRFSLKSVAPQQKHVSEMR